MTAIDYINLFLAAFLFIIGILVKRNPKLIAGVNAMNGPNSMDFDLIGYSTFMQQSLTLGSILIIFFNFFFNLLKFEVAQLISVVLLTTIIPIYISYRSKDFLKIKHSNNSTNRRNKILMILVIAFVVLISTFIYYVSLPPKISYDSNKFIISGIYGVEYSNNNISSIELIQVMPKILLKINGIGFSKIKKGYFNIDGIGRCKLQLQSNKGPYISLKTDKGELLIFNLPESQLTNSLYDNLSKTIKK